MFERGVSSAKRENFIHISPVNHSNRNNIACITQIAITSLVSLIYLALESQRSKEFSLSSRALPKYRVVVGCFKKAYLIFLCSSDFLQSV